MTIIEDLFDKAVKADMQLYTARKDLIRQVALEHAPSDASEQEIRLAVEGFAQKNSGLIRRIVAECAVDRSKGLDTDNSHLQIMLARTTK
jgi:hypothetical protein